MELIEVNPGPCLITQHLLENTNHNIIIFENNYNTFLQYSNVSTFYYFVLPNYR